MLSECYDCFDNRGGFIRLTLSNWLEYFELYIGFCKQLDINCAILTVSLSLISDDLKLLGSHSVQIVKPSTIGQPKGESQLSYIPDTSCHGCSTKTDIPS